MRATNRQRILDYLRLNGSITQLEATLELKPPMTSLSQEITRLEQEGYVFEHIDEKGQGTHWMRYRLVSVPVLELEVIGL